MPDTLTKEQRSHCMSMVKSGNTNPELIIRSALHKLGFRYRVCDIRLPGKPDLVFPKYHAVIFVHGCFWHGHNCSLFKWPKSNRSFWRKKISKNMRRDEINFNKLKESGWSVLVVWGCALKGRNRKPVEFIVNCISNWLTCDNSDMEIMGS